MKFNLFLIAVAIYPLLTIAQNPANSSGIVYPFIDFTLMDTDGNWHTLSSYLNSGKTVILDFMEPECGPCWDYHSTHALTDFYNANGPSGTNTAMVFQVNTWPDTGVPELSGNNGGSWNWLSGIPYPTVTVTSANQITIVGGYNAWGTPTLVEICPDGSTWAVNYPYIDSSNGWPPVASTYANQLAFETFVNTDCNVSTSTLEQVGTNIFITPNPASDMITIEGISMDEIKYLELINSLGKITFEQNLILMNEIRLPFLEEGVYFLKIHTETGEFIKKVLINK